MKIFTGKITARKMTKTIAVMVERTVIHPLYRKRFKVTRKYLVHDDSEAKVGETVKFGACRPYSKMVKWQTVKPVVKPVAKPKIEVKSKTEAKLKTAKKVSKK